MEKAPSRRWVWLALAVGFAWAAAGFWFSDPEGARPAGPALPGVPDGLSPPEDPRAVDPAVSAEIEPEAQRPPGLFLSIVDLDGAVVPGATVALTGTERRQTTADASGVAAFSPLPPGRYRVTVRAEGRPALQSVVPVVVPTGGPVELQALLRACDAELSGVVADVSGQPLGGISIRCQPIQGAGGALRMMRVDADPMATSGSDGSFTIIGLAPGDYRLVTEARAGLGRASATARAPTADLRMIVAAERTVVFTGVVRDEDGRPLDGASVIAGSGDTARTDADGRYRLGMGLPAGRESSQTLQAQLPGYETQFKATTVPLEGVEDGLQMDFRLFRSPAGSSLSGTVRSPDGAPVPELSVLLEGATGGYRRRVVTGPQGGFRFPDVPAQAGYTLKVLPTSTWLDTQVGPVTIGSEPLTLDVVVQPAGEGTLKGRIVDASGAPLPGFTVWVSNPAQRAGATQITSDRDGRFVAQVVAGDLMVETRALPKLTVRGLLVAPGRELDVVLPVGLGKRIVAGTVRLLGGDPVAGARVVVTWSAQDGGVRSSLYFETLTDEAGGFAVAGIGPGRCSIRATAVGVDPAGASVDIPAGEDPDPVELTLR